MRASVDILGGDNFVRPGLITNNYHFPDDPTVIARGGTITFYNMTREAHTNSLVTLSALPKTTNQVDSCGGPRTVCNAVNTAFGLNGNGPPTTTQPPTAAAGADS